jgi:ubiquinone biosynthesis protein UbiJ
MSLSSALLTSNISDLLTQYISLDPDAAIWLAPLSGKVVAIKLQPFNQTTYLQVYDTGLQLLEEFQGEADTTLSGTPIAFGLMGLSKNPMRSLFSGEIEISGDSHTGRQFQKLFKNLDIDWEEQLSKVTGDVAAHKIGNSLKSAQEWAEEAVETFNLNMGEFLQEETRDLPARPEVDNFYEEVDSIRADTDRLEARLKIAQQISASKAAK